MLNYSVYVAPSKFVVSDDLPPGEARRMWSPTASTLIYGAKDAVLVDPLMTIDESIECFPDATLVATPVVAAHMGAQWGPRWFDGFWDPRFPGQISYRHVVARPLAGDAS